MLGERIVWLHDKLKELELQKYQFLRHVSHELKTPLAVLREGTDLLCEQLVGPLTPDQLEICQMLDENSRRLQTLIERLLDFNRLSQQEAFELEPVPRCRCCRNFLQSTGWHWSPSRSVYTCRPCRLPCGRSPTGYG